MVPQRLVAEGRRPALECVTNQLRANGFTSRGEAASSTGIAAVNLNDALDLTFSIDLGTDSDVCTFDELVVEYLPVAP